MLITRITPTASEKPLARMNSSEPNAIPLMTSPRTSEDVTASNGATVAGASAGHPSSRVAGPPRASAALREVAREDRVLEELRRRLLPELRGVLDLGELHLVVRLVH